MAPLSSRKNNADRGVGDAKKLIKSMGKNLSPTFSNHYLMLPTILMDTAKHVSRWSGDTLVAS